MDLKRTLCDVYEEHSFYGYRKMTMALRDQGFNVGKKPIRTLKQKLGLKTMYPEPKTSIPNKAHKKLLLTLWKRHLESTENQKFSIRIREVSSPAQTSQKSWKPMV